MVVAVGASVEDEDEDERVESGASADELCALSLAREVSEVSDAEGLRLIILSGLQKKGTRGCDDENVRVWSGDKRTSLLMRRKWVPQTRQCPSLRKQLCSSGRLSFRLTTSLRKNGWRITD